MVVSRLVVGVVWVAFSPALRLLVFPFDSFPFVLFRCISPLIFDLFHGFVYSKLKALLKFKSGLFDTLLTKDPPVL
jgi:hypothetical protein